MQQYLNLLKHVLEFGKEKENRTKTSTISTFGYQMHFDLQAGFPLLTTKKIHWKSVVYELLWFIKGDTNIKFLVDHDVKIWNEWPYEKYKNSTDFQGESLSEYVSKIKTDAIFAQKHGNLGSIYGKQWRDFGGVDQLRNVIDEIKNNPNSRRLIVSAWNVKEIESMTLPPCHLLFQFYVENGTLSCQLYQRSADIFLGVPFNIASYSLLTHLIAQETGLKVGKFIHTIGDAHIYLDHIEQVKIQLNREPKNLPQIKLNPHKTSVFDFEYEDIILENYNPHSLIKGKVAV